RNSIVIAYQRTWNRLTACSADGNPPVNGTAVRGERAIRTTHDTPYTTPYISTTSPSRAAAALNPVIQPPSFPPRGLAASAATRRATYPAALSGLSGGGRLEGPEPAQPQTVGDHEHGAERHRGRGDQR